MTRKPVIRFACKYDQLHTRCLFYVNQLHTHSFLVFPSQVPPNCNNNEEIKRAKAYKNKEQMATQNYTSEEAEQVVVDLTSRKMQQ